MKSSEFEKILDSEKQKTILTWFYTMLHILGSCFLLLYAYSGGRIYSENTEAIVKFCFYGAGVIIAVFSYKMFSDKKIITQLMILVDAYSLAFNNKTEELNKVEYEQLSKLSEKELKIIGLAKWYDRQLEKHMLINLSISVLGFFLAIITVQFYQSIPFIIVDFLLSLYTFNGWDKVIKKGRNMLEI